MAWTSTFCTSASTPPAALISSKTPPCSPIPSFLAPVSPALSLGHAKSVASSHKLLKQQDLSRWVKTGITAEEAKNEDEKHDWAKHWKTDLAAGRNDSNGKLKVTKVLHLVCESSDQELNVAEAS
ncbi:hypothetical protein CPB84DRAFT_1848811 [Gymnopilus junonius]|uniref:Uncharacterized protein n=1 Tax=Gymnopilus junonius TaxID=109634 RepID=A0A9P5TLM4_GYMJU|nr:hypothetical protein CPB84DRAFT_1848811 [Gymnopilus junonius]